MSDVVAALQAIQRAFHSVAALPQHVRVDHSDGNVTMFNFEKLDTWNEAIAFADIVYRLTRGFPPEERFGLTNQMRRAAVSISSNLAEGCSRSSKADYARFVEIATGSVFEVVSQATIGRNQGFLNSTDYELLYGAAEKQSRMLSGLKKSLETR